MDRGAALRVDVVELAEVAAMTETSIAEFLQALLLGCVVAWLCASLGRGGRE